MRLRSIVMCTLSACAFTALDATAFAQVQPQGGQQGQYPQGSQQPQGQQPGQVPTPPPSPQQGRPQMPEEERKALEAMNSAPDAKAKVQAGLEYVKKFGKSTMRPRVAAYLAGEVAKVTDNVERVALAEAFAGGFNQPTEIDLIKPTVIDSLVKQNKLDEAFAEGAKFLAGHDDVLLQTQLAIVGIEQTQRQNPKYLQPAQQYAAKAIESMEADKRPTALDVAGWEQYRMLWLPRLYQAQGVVSYLTSDRATAKGKFEKSISLDAHNPSTLMMLGMLADDEYQQIAKQYGAEKPGPGKDAMLKQAVAKMDEVIDWFARAVASTDGKPEYQAMSQQLMQNMEAYYKFRNNGSTEGMSKIIDKYKKPAGQ